MRIMDGRRHQDVGLVAGVAEHDPLVAGAFVLVARGVDALGDVHRLGVDAYVDLDLLPMKTLLFVADILDRATGDLLQVRMGYGIGAAHLAGQDHVVGGTQSLDGDAGQGIAGQIRIDDGVGNTVADLVRMPFGNRFTGE